MTMQITAPQAQKRCCFIPISSCPETNSSLRVLRYYSRGRTLCITKSDKVMPVRTFFDTWPVSYRTAGERRRRTGCAAISHRLGYPQHTEGGIPQQLRRPLHPPLAQPGMNRQTIQPTNPSLNVVVERQARRLRAEIVRDSSRCSSIYRQISANLRTVSRSNAGAESSCPFGLQSR